MKTAMVMMSALLFSSNITWAGLECGNLKQQLKLMQKAQEQFGGTLVQNHELIASSLEEYASLAKSSPSGGAVMSSQMLETAKAFRQRGLQGKKIASKLNDATGDLLERVITCLKN